VAEGSVRVNGRCAPDQAEYVGLIQGLSAALRMGVQVLEVFGASELVVRQMAGLAHPQAQQPGLRVLHARALSLVRRFRKIAFKWIARTQNGGAESLGRQAMQHPEQALEAADWFRASP